MIMETKQFENGNNKNVPALFSSDPAAIAAAEIAKARIQAAYIMALQKPRNEDEARDRILHACRRPTFAERVEFSKPVSGRQIKGPSIRFAELALREWQNILTETQVIYEDDFIRRIKVFVTDLETNRIASKEIQINKTVERKKTEGREVLGKRINSYGEMIYIVKATEDELNNKEAAFISKAVRNEGLRLIPSDVTDEAIKTARHTLQNRDAKDPDTAKKKLLDAFSSIGVRPKDLEQYLGHKTDTLTPSELQDLRGIYRAIKDGESTWMDYISENIKTETPKVNASVYKTSEAPKEEIQPEKEDLPTYDFLSLNKEPLKEYEKIHRNEIQAWPQEAKDAFAEKWEKKIHQSYETFLRRLDLINGKETTPPEIQPEPKTGTVICPETGEAAPLAFCENAHGKDKPCERLEAQDCLARWPE